MVLAGALIEATASFIVQKLGDFAVGRISQQFLEIADDINLIKGDFSMTKAFLKDAEKRVAMSEAFNEWAKQVKNTAFMIEDFMDEYVYAEQSFQAGSSSSSNEVQNFKRQTEARIEAIKKQVAAVSRRGQVYGLHPSQSFSLGCIQDKGESSGGLQHTPLYSSPFEEVDMVGFDEDVRKLRGWLLTEEETAWSIMSIVGMGGSGKTTLAKKVSNLVQNDFDHHFLVSVSQYSRTSVPDFFRDIYEGLDYSSKGRQSRILRKKFTGNQDKWVHKKKQPQPEGFLEDVTEGCSSRRKNKRSRILKPFQLWGKTYDNCWIRRGEQMGCGHEGFPKLRHLHMVSLEFEEWTAIAEGAMPCIQFLTIVECKKLKMLPEGFERLQTLQSLEVIEMPKEFIARLMQEDNYKIQHIPKKTLHSTDDAGEQHVAGSDGEETERDE